ncbi:hypothetical protein B0H15DRAFT_872002 [Mycena belliarum]|uniref:Uncharacterized protein n=1 Tax=Mycena belliarum TaxID=1033014 RepID=A0AAD6TPK0_9AGAR|nr:hypothetical protein B0H15DRAFT_872002 [Mycena belliae]
MLRHIEYELLPTTGEAASPAVAPAPKRRIPLLCMAIGAAVLLIFIFAWPPSLNKKDALPQPRVYLRVGELGTDGFGSALQRFKQSIVLSGALDAPLVIAAQQSEHNYSTSLIYNTNSSVTLDVRNACRIREYIPYAARDRLVRGLCAGDPAANAEMQRIKVAMSGCTGIVDTDEDEITQDLNGCIMAWVRARLLSPVVPLAPPARPLTVGVHIRWGDTAGQFGAHFRGSMSTANIARVMHDVRASALSRAGGGVRLTIAMEHADPVVLARLNETDYVLLDSGDALADLHALSASDVLLLGESSYAVLAHLIAPPGLTIVELQGDFHKYENTSAFGREVVFMKDYTPEILRLPVGK